MGELQALHYTEAEEGIRNVSAKSGTGHEEGRTDYQYNAHSGDAGKSIGQTRIIMTGVSIRR